MKPRDHERGPGVKFTQADVPFRPNLRLALLATSSGLDPDDA